MYEEWNSEMLSLKLTFEAMSLYHTGLESIGRQ